MILDVSESPMVPIFVPPGFERDEYVQPLFGQANDELELLRKRDILTETVEAARNAESRKRFLLFGLAGVLLGSVVTGGMTALALRSYQRSGSVVRPAIYAGLGSAAMGGAMVFVLSRVLSGEKVDPRVAALAIGARMAG